MSATLLRALTLVEETKSHSQGPSTVLAEARPLLMAGVPMKGNP